MGKKDEGNVKRKGVSDASPGWRISRYLRTRTVSTVAGGEWAVEPETSYGRRRRDVDSVYKVERTRKRSLTVLKEPQKD